MKKSSFAAMVLGTLSGMLFALGMCMALIEEWNALRPGVALGAAGLVLGRVTLLVWRRMEHRPPVSFSGRGVLCALVGAAGALALGVGMCFCMVWGNMAVGILIGFVGIGALVGLIALARGIRE